MATSARLKIGKRYKTIQSTTQPKNKRSNKLESAPPRTKKRKKEGFFPVKIKR